MSGQPQQPMSRSRTARVAEEAAEEPTSGQKMSRLVTSWGRFAEQHEEGQRKNPFSGAWTGASVPGDRPHKCDKNYGRPVEGSLTEARGLAAAARIDGEIAYMCEMIVELGDVSRDGGRVLVAFGRLFDAYVRISNKLVGMLLRARRRQLVNFPGEILFQSRDDYVIIELYLPCPLLTPSNGSSA